MRRCRKVFKKETKKKQNKKKKKEESNRKDDGEIDISTALFSVTGSCCAWHKDTL